MSMAVDDVLTDRARARIHVLETWSVPLDPEEAHEHMVEEWGKKNIAAMAARGMGEPDDPALARPVVR